MTPYQQLWSVVEGATKDAFNMHPYYLTKAGKKFAVSSITKRVTGTVMSFAVAAARGEVKTARTVDPATSDERVLLVPSKGEAGGIVSPQTHCRIGRITIKKAKSSRFLAEFNATTNALLRARNERGK